MIRSYEAKGETRWRFSTTVTVDGMSERARGRNFQTKAEAKLAEDRARAELRSSLDQGKRASVRSRKLTFEQVWSLYHQYVLDARKVNDTVHRSWQTDKGRASTLIKHIGKRKLRHLLREEVIDSYVAAVSDDYALATIRKQLELMYRVLRWAGRRANIDFPGLAEGYYPVSIRKVDNREDRYVSQEELELIVAAAPERLKQYLVVAYDTGMRRGELRGLVWDSVDFEAGVITVRAETSKTRTGRQVPMTERVRAILSTRSRAGDRVFDCDCYTKDRAAINAKLKEAGYQVAQWKFHHLRHAFITNLHRAGVPPLVIMTLAGHTNMKTNQRYSHAQDQDLHAAVQQLNHSGFGQSFGQSCSKSPKLRTPRKGNSEGLNAATACSTCYSGDRI